MGNIVRFRKVQDTFATAFPKEMMERMGVRDGEAFRVEEKDGAIVLRPVDPEFQATMEAFDEIHREFYDAFRELAK